MSAPRAVAVLPVKRSAGAKTRARDVLGREAVPDVVAAMLADVLAALAGSRRLDRVVVVTGDPRAALAAGKAGAEVVYDPTDRGHSDAAALGLGRASCLGCDTAILVPGDCPLLTPEEVDGLVDRAVPASVGICPDRHGTGTNGLVLAPPGAIGPAFGPGSFERHRSLAREAGLQSRTEAVPGLALDLDTPDDLAELRALLASEPSRAPRTAAALEAIPATR